MNALDQKLKDLSVTRVNVFPGFNPNVTREQIEDQILAVLFSLETGEDVEITK